jgi:hypothetical protein
MREHSAFSDKEIQNFAARFVKLKSEFGMRQKCLLKTPLNAKNFSKASIHYFEK